MPIAEDLPLTVGPPGARASAPARASPWHYQDHGRTTTRDLRIDFMRGFVFLLLFTAHFEYFSWLALIGWERVGVVSSAETFIILAGVVTGSVYGKRLRRQGLGAIIPALFSRAWTLYRIAFVVAASIALLRLIPGLHTEALTSFTDPVTGLSYSLYPPAEKGFMYNLLHILFLKAGPHQFQVVGLYVVLFLMTPLIFWMIEKGRVGILLVLSWLGYVVNYLVPETQPGTAQIRLTGAQFEFAFPLLAWQLLFVHGVVAGYYRQEVLGFFASAPGRKLVALCIALSLVLAFFSLNHPLDKLPDWATLDVLPPSTFEAWYQRFFLKYSLGPGRLLNNFVLLVSVYALLTVAWRPIHRALGWLFIPLGQESMYVFFVHIYLILLITNTALPQLGNVWVNTAIHLGMLLACWLMVKKKFLFRWIPH